MTTIELVFDEYPDDAVTLRLSPVPMEEYFEILTSFTALKEKLGADGVMASFDAILAFLTRFAAVAIDAWSFREDPKDGGMRRRDFNWGMAVVDQWLSRMGTVPLPLPLASSGTAPSREASNEPAASVSNHPRSSSARRRTTR